MLTLIVLGLWSWRALATNTTASEGWQFDGTTRSTWDITWGCLSTIFACTWTTLHRDVPARNTSNSRIRFGKFVVFLVALLAPELVTRQAIEELKRATSTAACCNSNQVRRDRQTDEPAETAIHRSIKLTAQAQGDAEFTLKPPQIRWTIAQGYCINMDGLALRTEDGWICTLEPEQAQVLIEAGIIRCSDFRDRDIQDRAKADAFAKAITILQSTWSTINIVARAAYRLPISPLELSTVAYVACALFTYAFWWHKPKDMTTPITLSLRYRRSNLPQEFQDIAHATPMRWIHQQATPPKENISVPLRMYRVWRTRFDANAARRGEPDGSVTKFSTREEAMLDAFAIIIAVLFCAIHLAAYVPFRHRPFVPAVAQILGAENYVLSFRLTRDFV